MIVKMEKTYCFFILFLGFLTKLEAQIQKGNRFNIVLFLADNSVRNRYATCNGMSLLGFMRKPDIKDCTPELESKIAGSVPDFGQHVSNSCNCVDLLKNGLIALINYCRNVAGMTTVLASLKNDSFSNDLRIRKRANEYFDNDDGLSNQQRRLPKNLMFVPGRTYKYYKRRNNKRSATNSSKIVVKPEHSETFKIRSKRQEKMANEYNRTAYERKKKQKSKWQMLGIVETIKMTFLGNLLENGDDNNQELEHSHVSERVIGERQGISCLFELVSKALASVMDCDKGFLMIVLGGDLTDTEDVYSPLMQSVKHVVDNTNESETLIVVTGNCPLEDIEQAEIGLASEFKHVTFPVFIKGAHCELLTDIFELYDIPYSLRKILASMSCPNNEPEAIKVDYIKPRERLPTL